MKPLLSTLLLATLALAAVVAQRPSVAQPAPKPNILFIAVDDLNDWLGFMKTHPQVKTPNIDRLARRGTVFTNAHCQAPLCNPSRASLMTGLRPTTSGVYALNPWFRTSERLKSWVTLPQYLKKHGYRTLTTGKIYHDGYPTPAERVDGNEFDVWGHSGSFGPRPEKKFVQTPDPNPLVDWGVFPPRDEDQDDYKIADWAIEQIKKPAQQPFFLAVGLRHPHVPCYASQKWFDLYPEKSLKLPPVKMDDREDTPRFSCYTHWKLPEPRLAWLQRSGEWKPLVRAYLASISFMDAQVGRVLNELERSGKSENTVVVLWSDHGWHLGEKGVTGKNTLWDRSTRVPLVFAGPGIAKEARSNRPAELLDLYPTLIDLAGLPRNAGLDGHSLVPQLKDARTPRIWPAITTQGPGNHSVRTEDWRYIRYADGSEELYDTKHDPNEWTNLAAEPRFEERKRLLTEWLPRNETAPLPGSQTRLIELRDGVPYWEGKRVGPNDAIPMDD